MTASQRNHPMSDNSVPRSLPAGTEDTTSDLEPRIRVVAKIDYNKDDKVNTPGFALVGRWIHYAVALFISGIHPDNLLQVVHDPQVPVLPLTPKGNRSIQGAGC